MVEGLGSGGMQLELGLEVGDCWGLGFFGGLGSVLWGRGFECPWLEEGPVGHGAQALELES